MPSASPRPRSSAAPSRMPADHSMVRDAREPRCRQDLGVRSGAGERIDSREPSVRRSVVWATLLALLFTGLLVWVVLNHGRPMSWDRTLHAAALKHRAQPLVAA